MNPENGTYPIAAMGHRSHGATDVKITGSLHFQKLMFFAVAGPTQGTNNSLGPFCWSKSDYGNQVSHFSQPDCFDFRPTLHQWGYKWWWRPRNNVDKKLLLVLFVRFQQILRFVRNQWFFRWNLGKQGYTGKINTFSKRIIFLKRKQLFVILEIKIKRITRFVIRKIYSKNMFRLYFTVYYLFSFCSPSWSIKRSFSQLPLLFITLMD